MESHGESPTICATEPHGVLFSLSVLREANRSLKILSCLMPTFKGQVWILSRKSSDCLRQPVFSSTGVVDQPMPDIPCKLPVRTKGTMTAAATVKINARSHIRCDRKNSRIDSKMTTPISNKAKIAP